MLTADGEFLGTSAQVSLSAAVTIPHSGVNDPPIAQFWLDLDFLKDPKLLAANMTTD